MKLKNLLKHVFLSTSFLFSSQLVIHAQCPVGGVTFTSQTDLDNFILDYPTCEVIDGSVYIIGSDIIDLSPLSNIKTINGNLYIEGTSLTTLSGLENLTYVGGNLSFYDNTSLTTLSGLENLTYVGGSLAIYDNTSLTTLSALENLTYLGGALSINNTDLTTLSGLENLTYVGITLYIDYNSSLTTLSGLENLTYVGGDLRIGNNTDLTTLSALENLTYVGGALRIFYNTDLTTLSGLENLTYVGGDLYIVYNDNLMNVHSLNNLDSIGGTLELYECALLNDLSGLSNLKSIHGGLLIGNCPLLENLNGLENLESLDGGINIFNNLSLTDISGIRNIDPTTVKDYLGIYGLNIQNNPLLSVCNYSNICAIKDLVGVSPDLTIIEISGNAGDCADLAALDMACLTPLSTHGIELIAKTNASTVHIEWKVLSDPKPFTFNVQRSIDGQNWSTINSMPSRSGLLNPSYTFVDYTPNQGENYYRIQATNTEGDVFYSSMKYVELGSKNQSIIFPNPAKDVITIQSLDNESVIIKNMVGQTLLEAETNTKIDLSSLPSGIYMILFESGESLKLIKE